MSSLTRQQAEKERVFYRRLAMGAVALVLVWVVWPKGHIDTLPSSKRLEIHMGRDQVRQILGPPDRSESSHTSSMPPYRYTWTYRDNRVPWRRLELVLYDSLEHIEVVEWSSKSTYHVDCYEFNDTDVQLRGHRGY